MEWVFVQSNPLATQPRHISYLESSSPMPAPSHSSPSLERLSWLTQFFLWLRLQTLKRLQADLDEEEVVVTSPSDMVTPLFMSAEGHCMKQQPRASRGPNLHHLMQLIWGSAWWLLQFSHTPFEAGEYLPVDKFSDPNILRVDWNKLELKLVAWSVNTITDLLKVVTHPSRNYSLNWLVQDWIHHHKLGEVVNHDRSMVESIIWLGELDHIHDHKGVEGWGCFMVWSWFWVILWLGYLTWSHILLHIRLHSPPNKNASLSSSNFFSLPYVQQGMIMLVWELFPPIPHCHPNHHSLLMIHWHLPHQISIQQDGLIFINLLLLGSTWCDGSISETWRSSITDKVTLERASAPSLSSPLTWWKVTSCWRSPSHLFLRGRGCLQQVRDWYVICEQLDLASLCETMKLIQSSDSCYTLQLMNIQISLKWWDILKDVWNDPLPSFVTPLIQHSSNVSSGCIWFNHKLSIIEWRC